MPDDAPHSTQLLRWLEHAGHGDAAAQEEILRHIGGRLQCLTRKLLADYPGVRRWEQTDDVLQNATLRLLRALREVRPASMRALFGLASLQIRRELLDLAKHYYGPQGGGAHHASQAGEREPLDATGDPSRLAQWCEVHNQVNGLPAEERETFELLYYQGLSQAEAAALLGTSVRTVQRRWKDALVTLHDRLHGEWPSL
jgi:RNA polymerase sigma-70 factor (ECF subfamily)